MKISNVSLQFALAICITLCTINNLFSQPTTIEVFGDITENTTWSDDTVKVTGDITVLDDIILTINPGTWINFMGNYGIEINGYLIAEGIPGDTIVFTRIDTLGFWNYSNNDGGWKGLEFTVNGTHQDTSRLSICKVSFVKSNENSYGAIINRGDYNLKIWKCTIENNYGNTGGGIYSYGKEGASLHVEDCMIINNFANQYGGGIYGTHKTRIVNNRITDNHAGQWGGGICLNYCDDVISGNIIKNNYSGGSGGGLNNRYGSPLIDNNTFENNQCGGDGGGIYCSNFSRMRIINNRFTNNTATTGGGIHISYSEPEIINNIINNNEASMKGGGINLRESDADIINNTICSNFGGNGGGLNCDNSKSVLINTILWNNAAGSGNQVYIEDNFSSPDIFYCTVKDSTGGFGLSAGTIYQGTYQNNIEFYPMFADTSAGSGVQTDAPDADWSVLINSPCINSGNPDLTGLNIPSSDIRGNDRISHGRIDMGAIETNISRITVGGIILADSAMVADTIFVTGDIIVPDGVTLTISPGSLVLFDGHFKIDVKGTLLALGSRTDTIFFRIQDTLLFSNLEGTDGSWDGIYIDNGPNGANGAMNDNDSSLLVYCSVSYAKTLGNGGAMSIIHFSKVRIEHCVIENNGNIIHPVSNFHGGGIMLDHSSPYINSCRFSNNFSTFSGAAIYADDSDFTLTNSILDHNIIIDGQGQGAAINMRRSSPLINNCDIFENQNELGSAGGLVLDNSDPIIMNCRITNNISEHFFKASAIQCNYGKPLLINNLIANNNQYALRFRYAEDAIFINNTIVNNTGWSLLFDQSISHIYNTIFWGNTGNGQLTFENNPSGTNNINFHNCIIEDGIDQAYFDAGYINDYSGNLDIAPNFIQPTAGAGINYDGLSGNWAVDIFSPCINAGSLSIPEITLPSTDLTGNPRINATSIDIGAYEDQGGPANIKTNPYGGSRCEGDSILFSIEVVDLVTYQWQRNNVDIPGANSDSLAINPVMLIDEGVYRCQVSNSYGSSISGEAFLIVKSPPDILAEPSSSWYETNTSVNLSVIATGSIPVNYQWKKDHEIISGANSPEFVFHMVDSSNEGKYSCLVSNSCGMDSSFSAVLFMAPQICMVTVSETSGYNLIIWEKESIAPIMAYNVYRESSAAGIYDRLATISYDELSVFVDTMADPTVQAYLYKITAIDTSENETDADLCKPHKTIHLLVSTNPELNTTQLEWDRYYGFEYASYFILRSVDGSVFSQVHDMSSNLHSWTDPDPVEGELVYRIAVERPDPCYPTDGSKKAGTGPYNHSLSNLDDNRLQAGQLPPDTITLSNNSIEEENMPTMMIGKLFTEDEDSIDSHTYQFVPGDGDDDNISFTLLGDLLLASESFDYETKSQYSVRIRSTDQAGNYCEVPFIIQIIDIDETTGLPVISAGSVKAYPNPFSHSTTVVFPNPEGKPYRMYLMNIAGKVVKAEAEITTSSFNIERGNLEKGLYFIELRGPETYRGKLVIE